MPSVIDVCNRALDKLGQNPITSLDDGSTAAGLCDRNWPLVRDEVLREHPWNFAVKRKSTAPETSTPAWGFTYQHPLPTDCLKLLEVKDLSSGEYQVEDNRVLADSDTLYIRYIQQVTDPNTYDSLFINAVAARLAFELSEKLTQSNTKREMLWQEYLSALASARSADAKENPPVLLQEDDWISVRL